MQVANAVVGEFVWGEARRGEHYESGHTISGGCTATFGCFKVDTRKLKCIKRPKCAFSNSTLIRLSSISVSLGILAGKGIVAIVLLEYSFRYHSSVWRSD